MPFRACIEKAYTRVLLPYNGWISERSFKFALPAVPGKWQNEGLAPSEDVFWESVVEWHAAIETVLTRAEGMLNELNLRDDSKSL